MPPHSDPDATASGTLHTLGDIFACIPGLLGFYPQESAIILTLERDPILGGVVLGPVLRADLCHADRIADYAATNGTDLTESYFGLIVSRIPNSPLVAEAMFELGTVCTETGLPLVDACWHLSEIATGTPYTLLFGPSPAELREANLPPEWIHGTVTSVIAQPTMGPLLAQGALPELDREDTRAFFDPLPGTVKPMSYRSMSSLYREGERLVEAIPTDPAPARAAVQRACDILLSADAAPFLGDTSERTPRVSTVDPSDVRHIALMMTRSRLRDCLIRAVLDDPHAAATVLLEVARSYEGIIRANALSLWATAAVKLKLTSWASAALECAQEEISEHSLSCILMSLLRTGEHETLLHAALLGCLEVWEDLGE